jgi:hypothetical protein
VRVVKIDQGAWILSGCLSASLALACASDPYDGPPAADGGRDAQLTIGDTDNPRSIVIDDAGAIADAGQPDAFFINDPAPPICTRTGEMLEPAPLAGPADCPADKNREGCPCDKPGARAACWPGKRVNRNHGACMDGVTTCGESTEFGAHWGPCEGYVLPSDGVLSGPQACRCFSKGEWALNNLVPCIYQDDSGVYLYSSHPHEGSGYECVPASQSPPLAPTEDWNSSTLDIDCAGQFKLCYTLKAGQVTSPKASDCVLMQACIDTWYDAPGKAQTLPNLPGWIASDSACTRRFIEVGGYGEMSVFGKSMECTAVDDGHGRPYVFRRTSYCPSSCAMTPERAECQGCATGGAGEF